MTFRAAQIIPVRRRNFLVVGEGETLELDKSALQVEPIRLVALMLDGIKLHRNYAKGSDGRLGNHFVEVKTITPFKNCDVVEINLERNFSKVLIVKINADFEVRGKLLDRKALPKGKVRGSRLRIDWSLVDAK